MTGVILLGARPLKIHFNLLKHLKIWDMVEFLPTLSKALGSISNLSPPQKKKPTKFQ